MPQRREDIKQHEVFLFFFVLLRFLAPSWQNTLIMKLFFRQSGDTGSAVIFLHGIFGSSDNYVTISKAIAAQGFRVFSVDQRNHGQSPRSDEFDYDMMAADLHEFIQDHQLDKPVLIGHSMGGKTVMQYAMSYPDTFSKLIVVDIAPRFYPVHHGEILRGFNAVPLQTLSNRNEADAIFSEYERSAAVRQFLLKNLYRNAEGKFDWRINVPVLEREIHGVGEELKAVRQVTEPTLFMRGSESPYITEEDEQTIKRIFPNAIVQTIAGAGHWVQAEKPAEFVEAVLAFIA